MPNGFDRSKDDEILRVHGIHTSAGLRRSRSAIGRWKSWQKDRVEPCALSWSLFQFSVCCHLVFRFRALVYFGFRCSAAYSDISEWWMATSPFYCTAISLCIVQHDYDNFSISRNVGTTYHAARLSRESQITQPFEQFLALSKCYVNIFMGHFILCNGDGQL
jgi:hypothetical protein